MTSPSGLAREAVEFKRRWQDRGHVLDLPEDERQAFFAELDACLPLVGGQAEAWDGAFAMSFGVDEAGLPRLRELRIGDGVLSSVSAAGSGAEPARVRPQQEGGRS